MYLKQLIFDNNGRIFSLPKPLIHSLKIRAGKCKRLRFNYPTSYWSIGLVTTNSEKVELVVIPHPESNTFYISKNRSDSNMYKIVALPEEFQFVLMLAARETPWMLSL